MPAVHTLSDVALVADLFANASRTRIIAALADGRSLPASVLAAEAGVAASTCSEHLGKLLAGGLVRVEASGRHRYYALADERVAAAFEALSVVAPQRPVRSLRESTRMAALRRARSCYDHLAGRLGVSVTEALIAAEALVPSPGAQPYQLGPSAPAAFAGLGVDLEDVASLRRPLLRFCVDWTEQRHHLAGALGFAVLSALESNDWVRREPRRRSLTVTEAGSNGLDRALGIAV